MKKIIMAVCCTILLGNAGFAQTNLFGIGWEINFPNNSDYLTKTSFAGGKVEYRHFFGKKNMSAGIAMNWASYEQYIPTQTFEKPDGTTAVTSDFIAQNYQLPITATFHYYLEGTKMLKPYFGIGLGAQYLEQSLYYNVYVSDDNNWGFVARPEIGVLIKPASFEGWGFILGASYSYSTNKTELLDRDSYKNFGITLGVFFGQ